MKSNALKHPSDRYFEDKEINYASNN